MQIDLELLAPAKDSVIGTAAIDCGADAVYMAGPAFGARYAAANPIGEVGRMCDYAHKYGAKVYATVNTLLEQDELIKAEKLVKEYYDAGVDALIVQDPQLLTLDLPPIELHASTQAVVRTPERARELEKAGFTRLILERQMSLAQIRAIREAVSCELEFFVHGALCMSYSGQCYLSEQLTGRSANRGCCAQPCRSLYDVFDADGKLLSHDHHILSMKDYRLDSYIEALAEEGICSFKIEGRLKNASYVKNIVRHYRQVLDNLIARHPDKYRKSSFGTVEGGFSPDPDLTFNRGYTSCFIEGHRSKWNSTDAAKALGEYIGTVKGVSGNKVRIDMEKPVANGDGLSFVSDGDVTGMRADVVDGQYVTVKDASSITPGMRCYRNLNIRFEKELEKNMPRRLINAVVDYSSSNGKTRFTAKFENGHTQVVEFDESAPAAQNPERAMALMSSQIGKTSGRFSFSLGKVETDTVYSYTAATLNGVRRQLAELEENAPWERAAIMRRGQGPVPAFPRPARGELMRSKYCVKYELGLCGKKGPLFIENNGRRFRLEFDCANCEMIVTL